MTVYDEPETRKLQTLLNDKAADFTKSLADIHDQRVEITKDIVARVDIYNANPHTRISADSKFMPGGTALHLAVFLSAPNTAQTLIDNGADIDAVDDHGNTPAHYLASEVNIGYESQTGKKQNAAAMLDKLIENDADLSIKNADGETALDKFNESARWYKQGGPDAHLAVRIIDSLAGNHYYDVLKPIIEKLEIATTDSVEMNEKILAKAGELAKEMLEARDRTISIEEAIGIGVISSEEALERGLIKPSDISAAKESEGRAPGE